MAPRQSYEDVFQCRRVRSQLGQRDILPRQFREQSGDGSMELGHLHEHGAIFRSDFTYALDAAQGRHVERLRGAARSELDHLFRAGCSDQFARRAQSDLFAMIHDGHAVAKALGFVHVVCGEQNGAAGLFEFLDQFPELAAGLGIQTRGGLVEKKKVGVADQGAGKSQALFLAAGKIAHARILFFFELHTRDDFGGSRSLPKKAAKQTDCFMHGEFLGELCILQLNTEALAELCGVRIPSQAKNFDFS